MRVRVCLGQRWLSSLCVTLLLLLWNGVNAYAAISPALAPARTNDAQLRFAGQNPAGAITTLKEAKAAVIRIEVEGVFSDLEQGGQAIQGGSGSGFIISPDGIAITNNHVVSGAAFLHVFIAGESKPRSARVLGVDECADLAVIDIEGDGLPYLNWYEGDIDVSLKVYAAGFPLGDPEFTMTDGIVAKAKVDGESRWASVAHVLEHTAVIRPGNSGGPLLDSAGRVVGINYAGNDTTRRYFAISRDEALPIIKQLQSGKNVDSLGINAVAWGKANAYALGIQAVQAGSAFDQAGVKPGDFLLSIENIPLATKGTMTEYCNIIRSHKPDDVLRIQVFRASTKQILEGQLNGRVLAPIAATPEAPEASAPDVTAIQADDPVFRDDFQQDNGGWDTGSTEFGARFYKNGAYHIGAKTAQKLLLGLPSELTAADFLLEVKTKHINGTVDNEFGLVFRQVDGQNYYYFAVSSKGNYLLAKLVDNEWKILIDWRTTAALEQGVGATNLLGVLAIGSQIYLFANGEALTSVEDDTFADGRVGVATGAHTDKGVEVAFDDFALWSAHDNELASPTPTATKESIATPTPESSGGEDEIAEIESTEPLFRDNLSQDDGDWGTDSDKDVKYKYIGRALHIAVNAQNLAGWSFSKQIEQLNPSDFLVEVDATQIAGPEDAEFGLVFRYVDKDNYYNFVISRGGDYQLTKRVNGEWQTLVKWTKSDFIEPGKNVENRLGVLAKGPQLTLLVNGKVVDQVEDDAFGEGSIGLWAGNHDEPGVEVAFRQLVLWTASKTSNLDNVMAHITAIKNHKPQVSDAFRQNNGLWSTRSDKDVSYTYNQQALHIRVKTPKLTAWSDNETNSKNFLVEVETTQIAGSTEASYGLILRRVDNQNFYYFAISRSGQYLFGKWVDGKWASLVNEQNMDAIAPAAKAVNRLGVLAEGSQLTLLVNDTVLIQVEDDSLAEGSIGLTVTTPDKDPVEVAFDNFALWQIEQ